MAQMVALGVLKAAKDSYLPHSSIEPEMRSSTATLLGYVGGVLVAGSHLPLMPGVAPVPPLVG